MTERRLMGVREAAKELGVSPSTISRGIGKHFSNHGSTARPLVDLAEVIDARTNRLEPEKQAAAYRARGVQLSLPDPETADDDGAQPGPGGRILSTDGELGRERLRKVRAEADRAEMDNLERQQSLAPVGDFADAGFELGQLLRRCHGARLSSLTAAILAAGADPGRIAQAITDSDRDVEAKLADKVEKILNGEGGDSEQSGTA